MSLPTNRNKLLGSGRIQHIAILRIRSILLGAGKDGCSGRSTMLFVVEGMLPIFRAEYSPS